MMKASAANTKVFDTRKSIAKAAEKKSTPKSVLTLGEKNYVWNSGFDRVGLVRKGIPYASIEAVGKRINAPISQMLSIVDMPQTTYNKKKKDNAILDSRDSEFILILSELIDFGIEVFNQEPEKFQRWLKKPNVSIGGNTPESLMDTLTGIQEIRNALNRIEFGNFA